MSDAKRESVMNPAQSENPGMLENFVRENRETPQASGSSKSDRLEKATSYTASMHASGESDSAVVPTKCPNKGTAKPAEGMEGRALAKKNQRSVCTIRALYRNSRVTWAGRRCGGCLPRRHYSRQEPYALKCARTDLCGGRLATDVPTATERRFLGVKCLVSLCLPVFHTVNKYALDILAK